MPQIASPPPADAGGFSLPPHDTEIERAALGCVMLATASQAEVDALLLQLRPQLFYDLRHKLIFTELTRMRMEGHALDQVTLHAWLKGRESQCGGIAYLAALPDAVPSLQMFVEYLKQLKALARRRWALAESARLADRARNGDIDLADLRAEFSDALEKVEKDSAGETRLIQLLTVAEFKAYVPEPRMFLIGTDMVSLGEITLLAGLPGIGKSRLARCLAFALGRGTGHWMGYEVRRRARTLILQSEDSIRRIQSEVKDLPDDIGEWLRISAPTSLNFGSSQFRAELRRIWEDWPFDVLIIDPWSDVIRDEKFADMQEAFENVLASLPGGDRRPAVVIVAHLKKQVLTERPMIGRQLLGQISGSFRIGQKARTVFVVQQVSMETDDDRVVFDCAKANNEMPQPMSCWYRRNGEFQPCQDFDFDAWLNPPEEGARGHKPDREEWAKIFSGGPAGMTKKTLADRLMQDRHCATASAYRWIDGAVKAGLLTEVAGVIGWKGKA
jgi:hypothetical protein